MARKRKRNNGGGSSSVAGSNVKNGEESLNLALATLSTTVIPPTLVVISDDAEDGTTSAKKKPKNGVRRSGRSGRVESTPKASQGPDKSVKTSDYFFWTPEYYAIELRDNSGKQVKKDMKMSINYEIVDNEEKTGKEKLLSRSQLRRPSSKDFRYFFRAVNFCVAGRYTLRFSASYHDGSECDIPPLTHSVTAVDPDVPDQPPSKRPRSESTSTKKEENNRSTRASRSRSVISSAPVLVRRRNKASSASARSRASNERGQKRTRTSVRASKNAPSTPVDEEEEEEEDEKGEDEDEEHSEEVEDEDEDEDNDGDNDNKEGKAFAIQAEDESDTWESAVSSSQDPIPPFLSRGLVDEIVQDWENITQKNVLVVLPKKPDQTVEALLSKFSTQRRFDIIAQKIVLDLWESFDMALPTLLLYKAEKEQYQELLTSNGGHLPSAIYGAEHLLRMLLKASQVIEIKLTKVEKDSRLSVEWWRQNKDKYQNRTVNEICRGMAKVNKEQNEDRIGCAFRILEDLCRYLDKQRHRILLNEYTHGDT